MARVVKKINRILLVSLINFIKQIIENNMDIAQVYKNYHSNLIHFVSNKINNLGDAEDIVHNIFLKMQSDLVNLSSIKNIKSWLYSVAKNAVIDFYRSKRKNETENSINNSYLIENEPAFKKVADSIEIFINQLEEPYRKTLILSDLELVPQKKIAKELAIPYSTVKTRVQRGREKVKKMMFDCCIYEFDNKGRVIDYSCKNN
ncbi:MAG: sigma-70 family RNA polymerase sigma factor [Calditrichaeota bacterium]|nr:MAG: hypothetical protein DWQ03_01605 [Calditrichota bacterium]MBL1207240.1 sigma-70 family RNA polymerase sigma factor [Calditrichota bacterium]NOG47073.1 sigma-70 family RNA polymerase sigma factor [Calditrichota bacterium]